MENSIKNVVLALIQNERGQILIAKRNDRDIPDAHDRWELVGGKLEYGEAPEEAVVREVKEETGLDVTEVKFLGNIFSQFWKDKNGAEFQVLLLPYTCKVLGNQEPKSDDPKISELKFIYPDQILEYDFLPLDQEIVALLKA